MFVCLSLPSQSRYSSVLNFVPISSPCQQPCICFIVIVVLSFYPLSSMSAFITFHFHCPCRPVLLSLSLSSSVFYAVPVIVLVLLPCYPCCCPCHSVLLSLSSSISFSFSLSSPPRLPPSQCFRPEPTYC